MRVTVNVVWVKVDVTAATAATAWTVAWASRFSAAAGLDGLEPHPFPFPLPAPQVWQLSPMQKPVGRAGGAGLTLKSVEEDPLLGKWHDAVAVTVVVQPLVTCPSVAVLTMVELTVTVGPCWKLVTVLVPPLQAAVTVCGTRMSVCVCARVLWTALE